MNHQVIFRVKISPLLWLHRNLRLSYQKTIKVKWLGISLVFRDCAIIIRRGAEKQEGGGALHKIAAKIGGGSK